VTEPRVAPSTCRGRRLPRSVRPLASRPAGSRDRSAGIVDPAHDVVAVGPRWSSRCRTRGRESISISSYTPLATLLRRRVLCLRPPRHSSISGRLRHLDALEFGQVTRGPPRPRRGRHGASAASRVESSPSTSRARCLRVVRGSPRESAGCSSSPGSSSTARRHRSPRPRSSSHLEATPTRIDSVPYGRVSGPKRSMHRRPRRFARRRPVQPGAGTMYCQPDGGGIRKRFDRRNRTMDREGVMTPMQR